MRDHLPIKVEEFNGFFSRGDQESCPPDHFSDCSNVMFAHSSVKTRNGINTFPAVGHILRMYAYNSPLGEGLLMLNDSNDIYHVIPDSSIVQLILHVANMTDFGLVEINQFAFITPSSNTGPSGLSGQFLYIYEGSLVTARKAGGAAPVNADGALAAANSATAGNVEPGIHVFGVVYETSSGFLTAIGPDTLPTVTAPGNKKVDLTNIDVSGNAAVVARRIVATKAIDPSFYTGNTRGYQFFFVPNGRIPNNTATTLTVNFYDSELLEDASHLFDLFAEIPAGGGLSTYHNRLISWDEFANPDLVRVSFPGEPEAISQVDGLILLPQDGLGITRCQEYRDILYVFKINQTIAFADNQDVPSSWPDTTIDQGLGCNKHGMCVVNEKGSINIEFLLIHNYSGIFVFNGTFAKPELSWKIKTYWAGDNNSPGLDQIMIGLLSEFYNDPESQVMYINLPNDKRILAGDYSNGMDAKAIKWMLWDYDIEPTTLSLFRKTNTLLIGDQNS